MTIIEKSTFTGVNAHECRPFARVRMGQQLKAVAEDQAYAYKTLTANAVPNAPGSDVATDHIHDGTDGAVIPIPVAQDWLGANLAPQANAGDYVTFLFFPFFAPPGFDTFQLHLLTRTPDQLSGMARCAVLNSSLNETAGGSAFTRDGLFSGEQLGGGVHTITSTLTVTANSLNVIRLEMLEHANLPPADLLAYSLLPYFGEPHVRRMSLDYPDANTSIVAPDTTEHLGAHAFTSFDDGMFNDDDAISSYVVDGLNKNNVYLLERATGLAGGNRDTGTEALYDGHGHRGSTSPSTRASNVGALIDHSLGAWAYGSARAGPSGSHPTSDMANVSNTAWTGKIFAPTLSPSTTSIQEVVRHPIRLPGMSASGDYAHSSGKLKFAALVFNDYAKNGTMTVTAQMYSSSGGSSGTSQAVASTLSSGTGYELLTISGLDAAGTTSGEEEQVLSVSLTLTTNSNVGSVIYGTCLYVEA